MLSKLAWLQCFRAEEDKQQDKAWRFAVKALDRLGFDKLERVLVYTFDAANPNLLRAGADYVAMATLEKSNERLKQTTLKRLWFSPAFLDWCEANVQTLQMDVKLLDALDE